jgi:translation initiation factor 4E
VVGYKKWFAPLEIFFPRMTSKITVFQDPINFNVKHPLQNKWTLWYDDAAGMKQNQLSWDENLKLIMTVDTIEDFFGY